MDWGIKNRLSQLIQSDGRCFFLPIDHGYFQGPTRCLEKPGETIKPILRFYDALFVTRGVLRSAIEPVGGKPIILRVSGGTSMVGQDLANEEITTSIQEIVRLGVAAAASRQAATRPAARHTKARGLVPWESLLLARGRFHRRRCSQQGCVPLQDEACGARLHR